MVLTPSLETNVPARPYPSFLIYKDGLGQFRWRYQLSVKKTVAESAQGFRNRFDCVEDIQLIQGCSNSPIVTAGDVF